MASDYKVFVGEEQVGNNDKQHVELVTVLVNMWHGW
jgi:hypothetical protein